MIRDSSHSAASMSSPTLTSKLRAVSGIFVRFARSTIAIQTMGDEGLSPSFADETRVREIVRKELAADESRKRERYRSNMCDLAAELEQLDERYPAFAPINPQLSNSVRVAAGLPGGDDRVAMSAVGGGTVTSSGAGSVSMGYGLAVHIAMQEAQRAIQRLGQIHGVALAQDLRQLSDGGAD